MTFGEQIKAARESKHLSQEELAEQLGVSRQAVSKWENGTSLPHGVNQEALVQLLGLDLETSEVPTKKRDLPALAGWLTAAVLLVLILFSTFQQSVKNTVLPPEITGVQFYNDTQTRILSENLWYNTAEMDSILLQWSGGTPDSAKLFFTPSGTGTTENTELLLTTVVDDSSNALLLDGELLKSKPQGNIYFELDFQGSIHTSELYSVFYDRDNYTLLAYLKELDYSFLTFDKVEWVHVPSDRATALGITDQDAPNGFYIHNQVHALENLALSQDCTCSILNWGETVVQQSVTIPELMELFQERAGANIPYELTVENNEIVEIRECYVP